MPGTTITEAGIRSDVDTVLPITGRFTIAAPLPNISIDGAEETNPSHNTQENTPEMQQLRLNLARMILNYINSGAAKVMKDGFGDG